MAKRQKFSVLGMCLVFQVMAWWGIFFAWLPFQLQKDEPPAADRATVLTLEEYKQLADPNIRTVVHDHGKAALHKADDPNWAKREAANYKPILDGTYYIDARAYAGVDNQAIVGRLFRGIFPFATASLICLVIFLRRQLKQAKDAPPATGPDQPPSVGL